MMGNDSIKVTIQRGSHEIGGCCTTIQYKSTCIAIDLGSQLGEKNEKLMVPGLTIGEKKCDALFLTHYHGDHIGEADKVIGDIPIYVSPCAREIMLAYQAHMGKHRPYQFVEDQLHIMENNKPITIGEFSITSIPSDHSAVDSVMYLIEAGGKRILHTGDFRLHGLRKASTLEHIKHLSDIDLVITEGTTLSRTSNGNWNEEKVGEELVKLYHSYKYCFVLASSTNLDRIQMISEKVPRGKYFVVNKFQYEMMEIAEKYGLCTFNKALWHSDNLNEKMEKRGFVMVVNTNIKNQKLMDYYFQNFPQDTCLIYSMWSGYKEKENIAHICEQAGQNLFYAHSSGHVTTEDLNWFIETVKPQKIVVIHTEAEDKSMILYKNRVIDVEDGEAFIL